MGARPGGDLVLRLTAHHEDHEGHEGHEETTKTIY
jgi:hypothetical protein